MKLLVLISCLLVCTKIFCQTSEIPVHLIYKCRIEKILLVGDNSVVEEYPSCPIEVGHFKIHFSKAFYNRKDGELRIAGRVCLPAISDSLYGFPMGASICKGIIQRGVLKCNMDIGESTHDFDDHKNLGLFDIKFKLVKGLPCTHIF